MTETELQQVVDALAAKTAADAKAAVDAAAQATAAKRAALFAKAKAFVIHNAIGLSVGAAVAFFVVKVL